MLSFSSSTLGGSLGTACPTCLLVFAVSKFRLQLLLDRPHHVNVLLQHSPILGADQFLDSLEVFAQVIQDAGQHGPVMSLPVQLVEHLVGIADRSNRLIRPRVRPPCPCIGTIGNHHTEFKRTKSRLRLRRQLAACS